MDKRLVLITKIKWDKESKPVWMFPQVLREEGESMREASTCAFPRDINSTRQHCMYKYLCREILNKLKCDLKKCNNKCISTLKILVGSV